MTTQLCGEPNPGPDGGVCNHAGRCKGCHSWEPTDTDRAVLPPAVVAAIEGKPRRRRKA